MSEREGNLPASNRCSRSSNGIGARSGQSGVAYGRAGGDGSGKLPDGNVVVVAARGVARVDRDGRNTNDSAAGRAVEGAGPNADGRGRDAGAAVSGRENGVGIQQGAAAEVGTAALEGHDEREVASRGRDTTNDLEAILRNRSGSGEGRAREGEGSDNGLEEHGD